MEIKEDILLYLSDLKKRLAQEMPKVRKEIRLYEEKRAAGQLIKNPAAGPQFNV